MTIVKKILKAKGDASNYSVSGDATVLQALKLMAEEHIGAVFVTEEGRIIGIYTERDYVQKGRGGGTPRRGDPGEGCHDRRDVHRHDGHIRGAVHGIDGCASHPPPARCGGRPVGGDGLHPRRDDRRAGEPGERDQGSRELHHRFRVFRIGEFSECSNLAGNQLPARLVLVLKAHERYGESLVEFLA
jgi:hypothetical protein